MTAEFYRAQGEMKIAHHRKARELQRAYVERRQRTLWGVDVGELITAALVEQKRHDLSAATRGEQ